MTDIFLSYSRDDQATARRFAEAFGRAGLSVWWDQTLSPGEAFDEVTERALEEARAVVVLWSKKSVASRWVRAEATQANESGTLVPVMIEPCKRPIMFELTHTADLSNWKGDESDPAWQAYLAGVRRIIEKSGGRPAANATAAGDAERGVVRHSLSKTLAIGAPLALLLVVGAALWWIKGRQPEAPAAATIANAAPEQTPDAGTASASAASIAVMPFANLTGDTEKEYFSDGMAEELINMLSKVDGLKVASRSSSFAYKGKGTDPRQVARDLNVKTVLEGSVRSAGKTIRITAQLIDAESGYSLWSESYDRQYADLFKVQDDLAGQIVKAFRVTMGANLLEYAPQRPPTQDLDAYALYLKGVGAANGIDYLEQAVARDPKFARAYLAMALRRFYTDQPLATVERDARRAIELDPTIGAQAVLGSVEAARGNWLAAAKYLLESDVPAEQLSGTTISTLLFPTGQLRTALRMQEEIFHNGPDPKAAAGLLAMISDAQGHDAETIRYADIHALLPGAGQSFSQRARVHARNGRYIEATQLAVDALSPRERELGGVEIIGLVYAALADPARRGSAVNSLRELQRKLDQPVDWRTKVGVMTYFSQLGALDDAYATGYALQKQFEERTPGGGWSWMWSLEMSAFRRDARFQGFMTKLGMMPYWEKYGPPDVCDLKDGKLSCR